MKFWSGRGSPATFTILSGRSATERSKGASRSRKTRIRSSVSSGRSVNSSYVRRSARSSRSDSASITSFATAHWRAAASIGVLVRLRIPSHTAYGWRTMARKRLGRKFACSHSARTAFGGLFSTSTPGRRG